MALVPIEVPDDGMRLLFAGEVNGYQMISQYNPELVARAVAVKLMHRLIHETNTRKFS